MTIFFNVEPAEPDTQSLETLFNNIDLTNQHKQLIFETPDYYNIFIEGCGVFPLYTQTFKLSLGELLKLWNHTEWKQEDKYFYCITGSPLSGGNSSKYWSKEDDFSSMETKTFSIQFQTALWLLQTGNTEIQSRCTPIEIPHREPSKLTVQELVTALNSLPPDTINIC